MTSVLTARPLAIGFAGLGLVGALAGCSAAASTTASSTGASTTNSPASAASSAGSSVYKDGSYTESGSYQSPGGTESITVKLTIAADKVTAVTVTPHASGTAAAYQQQFVSGISAAVVGKDLSTLSVSRVAGSSLTSGGFNAAVKAIKADAAA